MDTKIDINKIGYYVDEYVNKGVSCDEYKEYTDHCFELGSLGEAGRPLFHKIARTSPKYHDQDTDKKFTEILRNHNGKRKIGSFIRLCTDVLNIPKYQSSSSKSSFKEWETTSTEIKSSDWKSLQVVNEPPEEIPLLSIGFAPIATAGNYSHIIGKKKSRKSLFLTWLITQYKSDQAADIILFDTEQGTRHVWKVMDRIRRMTGKVVGTFYLRGKSPLERRTIIEAVVREYVTRPKIVIIDGIRDLLSNINDPDQVSELLTWLEKLTLDNSLHVINVLHMNKTDNNARGHLGSELLNKSEITIELERDEKADCTIVKCESSRDIPFESFAFRHSIDGLPEIVDMPTAGKVLPEEEKKARVKFMFNDLGGAVKYADLVDGIKSNFGVGVNKAKILLADFNRSGWIVKNGIERSKDVVYKCMV